MLNDPVTLVHIHSEQRNMHQVPLPFASPTTIVNDFE